MLSLSPSWGESHLDLGSTGLCKSPGETSSKSLHLSETASSSVKQGESYLLPMTISKVKLGHDRKAHEPGVKPMHNKHQHPMEGEGGGQTNPVSTCQWYNLGG